VHQEDLCQALDQDPENKHGGRDPSRRIAFDGALELVTDVCGEPSGRQMATRMGFCVAAGNGDAHLKNWSLAWGEARAAGAHPLP
jgi:serine/threonine protein kinase HipA of HipAB toxin-antitoxin module